MSREAIRLAQILQAPIRGRLNFTALVRIGKPQSRPCQLTKSALIPAYLIRIVLPYFFQNPCEFVSVILVQLGRIDRQSQKLMHRTADSFFPRRFSERQITEKSQGCADRQSHDTYDVSRLDEGVVSRRLILLDDENGKTIMNPNNNGTTQPART